MGRVGMRAWHEIHRYRINKMPENNESCLQMQIVPAAELPQQIKKPFIYFLNPSFISSPAVWILFPMESEIELAAENNKCQPQSKKEEAV